MAIRILKAALNADSDGQSGLQQLAGAATMMGMEQGGNIGADMAQIGKDCGPEVLGDK